MKSSLLMDFTVDKSNNTVNVKREFDATPGLVWSAWTKKELLDQWWAPKPWKARTKSMDFSEGGHWLYAMVGPENEEHWARADYSSISPETNIKWLDAFCDKDGNINTEFPRSDWSITFSVSGKTTLVHITIKHENLSDLEKIIEMGFKEGFTMGLENLDSLLETLKSK